jgi:hypothetical protein
LQFCPFKYLFFVISYTGQAYRISGNDREKAFASYALAIGHLLAVLEAVNIGGEFVGFG